MKAATNEKTGTIQTQAKKAHFANIADPDTTTAAAAAPEPTQASDNDVRISRNTTPSSILRTPNSPRMSITRNVPTVREGSGVNYVSSIEGSYEKAVYYDAIVHASQDGYDDIRAIEMGREARTRAKEIHARIRQRAQEDADRANASLALQRQEEARQQQLEMDQLKLQQQQQAHVSVTLRENPVYEIQSSKLSETIANASPRWPEDIHSPMHPYTTPVNRTARLSTVLKKIVGPAVKKGIREGMPDLMIQPRMINNKLQILVDEFCHGLESEYNTRAREMLLAYRESVKTIETKTATKIAKEWEARANHKEADQRMERLEKENHVLKQQSMRTISANSALQKQMDELRREGSNRDEEYKLLIRENARRRLKCASQRRQIARLKEALQNNQNGMNEDAPSHYSTYQAPSSIARCSTPAFKVSQRGMARSDDGYDKSDSEREDRQCYSGDDGAQFGFDSTGSDGESVKRRAECAFSDQDFSDDDLDQEWEAWCRNSDFTKPGWSKSTASKLLSQNAPMSVIHIGENPAVAEEIISDAMARKASSLQTRSVNGDENDKLKLKKEWMKRVHSKCRREIHRLRELVDIERAKLAKGAFPAPASKDGKTIRELVSVLQECITSQERYTDLPEHSGSRLILGSSTLSQSMESVQETNGLQTFMDRIQSRESLLWRLISTLSRHEANQRRSSPESPTLPSHCTSPAPPSTTARSQRPHSVRTHNYKPRPLSASTRASTTDMNQRGIKSIQVLLAEIDASSDSEGGAGEGGHHEQVDGAESYGARHVSFGVKDVSSQGRPKLRPKSAPAASASGTLLPLHINHEPSPEHAILSRNQGVRLKEYEKGKPTECVEPSIDASRWQLLSQHYKNPYSNAFPPRAPLKKTAALRPQSGGGMVGNKSKWVPRPIDHVAGPHYGNFATK
ncbi:hypothetical protein HDU80_003893 [Chytriomyces hyalinus]|nr:hypothetical protein HDU80_003893 [Chytriomyces hyalinus]